MTEHQVTSGSRGRVATTQVLILLLSLNFLASSMTYAAPDVLNDIPESLRHAFRVQEESDNDSKLSIFETIESPPYGEASASTCAHFWLKNNVSQLLKPSPFPSIDDKQVRPTLLDFARLSHILKRRLATHQNFALSAYIDKCQRILLKGRALFFLAGVPVMESKVIEPQIPQHTSQESSNIPDLTPSNGESFESWKSKIDKILSTKEDQEEVEEVKKDIRATAGGSALSRFDELRAERDRFATELSSCKAKNAQEHNNFMFKLSLRDMELDLCRKQSERRLDIIKQATASIEEIKRDFRVKFDR